MNMLYFILALFVTYLVSCQTVPPDPFDQSEAAIFNKAFGTQVQARPVKKLIFVP